MTSDGTGRGALAIPGKHARRQPPRALAAIAPWLLAALICSGAAACGAPPSHDPAPEGEGGSAGSTPGSLSCTPELIELGLVVSGASSSVGLRCAATGGPVTVASVRLAGPAAGAFSVALPADGATVEPGLALELPVTFTATAPGSADATLALLDATGAPLSLHFLRAETIEHALALLPDAGCDPGLDLGIVPLGDRSETTLLLQNLSREPLTVSGLSVIGAAGAGFAAEAVLPAALAPGASLEVALSFAPVTPGAASVMVRITTDDPGGAERTICLRGHGGGPLLSCSPEPLALGEVEVGRSRTAALVCTNTGTDDPTGDGELLHLTAVTSSSLEVTAAVRGGLLAAGYGAGQSFTVDVTYAPLNHGPDLAELLLLSDALGSPEHRVPVTGSGLVLPPCTYELSTEALGFGIVEAGASLTLPLRIHNRSNETCRIQELLLTAGSDPAFTLPDGPLGEELLPAFTTRVVRVRFAPQLPGLQGGRLLLRLVDPAELPRTIELRGLSQRPCLRFTPGAVNFGVAIPGCASRERLVEVENVCDETRTILAVSRGAGLTTELANSGRLMFPAILRSGHIATLGFTYRPTDEGPDEGWFELETQEDPEPYLLQLEGEGALDGIQTDRFVQSDRPSVDILFVIDNSGSLSEEQTQLAEHLDSFLGVAAGRQLDFQLGVTTTGLTAAGGCPGGADGGEDGRLYPVDGSHPRILTASTPDLRADWAFNTNVGLCQSQEQGLEAAYRALSSPVVDSADDPRHPEPADGNLGFLRPGAALSLVFVSDENDQSPQTVDFYYDFFSALKGPRSSNLFTAHAIVGDPVTGCATAEAGERYLDLATRSGGVFQSFCQADWGQTMETIGNAAFGFKSRFFLTQRPAGELEVRLDGRIYPSAGPRGERRWEFVSEQVGQQLEVNAVDFYPFAVPEPGSLLEIRYHVECL